MPGTRGPYEVVNPPGLDPPPTSLLQTANVIEPDDEHWIAGITDRPENAQALRGVDPCTLVAPPATGYTGHAPVTCDPFVLEQEDQCSSFGWQVAEYAERATRGLRAKEAAALEAEFWRPTIIPGNLGLTTATPAPVVLNGGVAVSPALAIAYLNEAIARSQFGIGWIHATAFLVERWFITRAVTNAQGAGARLFSANGNPVIAGNGYNGDGPDTTGGPAEGQGATPVQWAFVTEPFDIYRTPGIEVYPGNLAEASQRELNLVTYRATRPYAHNWGRLLCAAIKVNVAAAN